MKPQNNQKHCSTYSCTPSRWGSSEYAPESRRARFIVATADLSAELSAISLAKPCRANWTSPYMVRATLAVAQRRFALSGTAQRRFALSGTAQRRFAQRRFAQRRFAQRRFALSGTALPSLALP